MRKLFFAFLLISSNCCFAQGMFGVQGGLGYTTAYNAHLTPAAEGYFLLKVTPRLYMGGAISFQRYSLQHQLNPDAAGLSYGDIIYVDHRSSYAFISPKIDFGIGYRKRVHVNVSFGPGFFMGGHQDTYEYLPYWTPASGVPFGTDTASVNTSYNIPAVIFQCGGGISERIPTHGYWNIMLSQQFSFFPTELSKHGPGMQTSYIAFTIGVMHKYPQVVIDAD